MYSYNRHQGYFKHKVRQQIEDYLYLYFVGELQDKLNALIVRNTLLGQFTHAHFFYKGSVYVHSEVATPVKKNQLLPELHPVMDEYLKERHEFDSGEYFFVSSYLTQVLNACDNIEDCRAAFPECVQHAFNNNSFVHLKGERTITDETILELQKKNEKAISWIKQRVLLNMITQ